MTNTTNSNGQSHNQVLHNRQGRSIAVWLPLGIGTGVALGVAFDDLALGIAIGTALAIVLGAAGNLIRARPADPDNGNPDGS